MMAVYTFSSSFLTYTVVTEKTQRRLITHCTSLMLKTTASEPVELTFRQTKTSCNILHLVLN